MKKSKLKRKKGEEFSTVIHTIKEENKKFQDLLMQANTNKQQTFQIQMKKIRNGLMERRT